MERKELVKSVSLIVAVFIISISVVQQLTSCVDMRDVGLCQECDQLNRIKYMFFHTSIIHAAVNVFAMLWCVFMCGVRMKDFVIAYVIAALYPFCYGEIVTVGISGMVYALFGLIGAGRRFICYCLLIIAFSAVIGEFGRATGLWYGSNWLLHFYCLMMGDLLKRDTKS